MKIKPLLLLLLPLFFVVSCSRGSNTDKSFSAGITLALMVKRADISWSRAQINGFKAYCEKHRAQYLVIDTRMDSNLNLSNIDTLISRKVDGIAVAVADQKMSRLLVKRVFEAGIPLVSLNYKLVDDRGRQLAPHIGIDYSAAGEAAAQWLRERLESNLVLSNPGITPGIAELTSPSVEEIGIWTHTIKKQLLSSMDGLSPSIFYSAVAPVNDAAGAMIAMQELLSTYPEVTTWVIDAGSSDQMAGALRALDQVGMTDYSYTMSIECDISVGEKAAGGTQRNAAILVDTYKQGEKAAELLYNYNKYGIPVSSITISPFRLVE